MLGCVKRDSEEVSLLSAVISVYVMQVYSFGACIHAYMHTCIHAYFALART
jgi:hypothetical protein